MHKSCDFCGIERIYLQRHHLLPRSRGGSDDPTNIAMLCANCHEDQHRGPNAPWPRQPNPPESCKRQGEAMRKHWADPEQGAKWREQRSTQRRMNGLTSHETLVRHQVVRDHLSLGLSQHAVASIMGISQSLVSRIHRLDLTD